MLIQLFEHSQSHGYPEGLKRKMTGVLAFFSHGELGKVALDLNIIGGICKFHKKKRTNSKV